MGASQDGQKIRSLATQISMMESAEKLIASKGIQNVSIKEIVREAKQKNESALQYHFKNLQGLIDAIHRKRNAQVQAKRAELLAQLQPTIKAPSLRDLCHIMVIPTYLILQTDDTFRSYVSAFSHELALAEESALSKVRKSGGGGESGAQAGKLLRTALPHLDESAYSQRMDLAVRMISIAMGHHARQIIAFPAPKSDLFISHLIDALEGLLSAPVSIDTRTFF